MRQPSTVKLLLLGRLGDGTNKNVFLEGGEIQPPGDDAGAARRGGEAVDRFRRPADRQVMVAASPATPCRQTSGWL